MKYLAWILFLVNAYFGVYYFLNAIYVLQSSKYSQASNIMFATLFLILSAVAFYFSFKKKKYKAAFLAGLAPWLIGFIILFITMLTADYK
jgi:hypothetical protein